MPEILKSLTFEDLPTRPPLVGRPRISEDLQQTVALLVGWDGATRRLVRVSPLGVLYAVSPPVQGIINLLADQAAYNWQGDYIETNEVMIRAHEDCVSGLWINVGAAAAPDTGYFLDNREVVVFSITNLHSLHIHIVDDTQKAFIIYTK